MKKKIVVFAAFALCVFVFTAVMSLRCTAKPMSTGGQTSALWPVSMFDSIKSEASLVAFDGPGSGGGRGCCGIIDEC